MCRLSVNFEQREGIEETNSSPFTFAARSDEHFGCCNDRNAYVFLVRTDIFTCSFYVVQIIDKND